LTTVVGSDVAACAAGALSRRASVDTTATPFTAVRLVKTPFGNAQLLADKFIGLLIDWAGGLPHPSPEP
jgi:hypothetical protein